MELSITAEEAERGQQRISEAVKSRPVGLREGICNDCVWRCMWQKSCLLRHTVMLR
jgi:hypothetical protein